EHAPVGVACHLGRDRRRAELAALADAMLQLPEQARLYADLIEPLAAQLVQQRAVRREEAASTRVEFFTMVRGD
ncbi:MAG: phosphonate C-P lyase system protein PhnG, partial [Paraburkholderia sp.]|uniref:phosphonate C-P lyase system protein PhnG n=1 Tax=Paraburkholderia sp. TaxID=1926495 RepID=UPI003C36A4B4